MSQGAHKGAIPSQATLMTIESGMISSKFGYLSHNSFPR